MKDGGPAFPRVFIKPTHSHEEPGMSLRDYFAAHAPAEYLGVMAAKVQEAGDNDTDVATDAMLAER